MVCRSFLVCILSALNVFIYNVCPVFAAEGSGLIADSYSDDLRAILADQSRQRVYVADSANSKLLIIDSVSLAVTRIALPGRPHWLALTKDSKLLGIALDTANVAIMDLTTLAIASNAQFEKNVVTFDFDAKGMIYFSTNDVFGSIWFGNPATGTAKEAFSGQDRKFFANGLVRTNQDGSTVYVADGTSGITQAIVSTGIASSVVESFGTVVGVRDFRISRAGDYIYVATNVPKGVVRIRALTMEIENTLETSDSSVAVDVSPDGSKIFVTTDALVSDPNLYIASATDLGLIDTVRTTRRSGRFFSAPQDRGLVTLNDGKLRLYLEGHNGSIDPLQKGWQVGIQGEVADKPFPVIIGSRLSASKLPNKGGAVTVTVEMSAEEYVSVVRVQSVCKFKAKSKSPVRKTIVLSNGAEGRFEGIFKYGKSFAGATCTFKALAQLTDSEPIESKIGRLTIATKDRTLQSKSLFQRPVKAEKFVRSL